MTNTVRADIIQGKLDRTMPVSLQSYMNPREWENLADEIDRAVAPAIRLQTCIPIAMVLWFLISAFIFFAAFASASSGSGGMSIGPIAIVPVLFVLLVVGMVVTTRQTSEKVQRDASNVCRRFTQQHSGTLSFHIKEEAYMMYNYHHNHHGATRAARYYLEIVVASADAPAPLPYASVIEAKPMYENEAFDPEIALPSAPPGEKQYSQTRASAMDRLAELETIKHLLSEEEYQEKRRSILDSL